MADARGRAYRKSKTSGIDDVRKWVGKWWGDTDDLEISEFTMSVPAPSTIKKLEIDEVFATACRNKRDSDLHNLLKYAAWIWLDKATSIALPHQSDLVRFEQQIYFPYVDETEIRTIYHPLGGEFDQTMAQLLRRGDNHVFFGEGRKITVHVFGKGVNIEVGNTQPSNLLEPTLNFLCERAVWVPFPSELEPKSFQLHQDKLRKITAYEIKIS